MVDNIDTQMSGWSVVVENLGTQLPVWTCKCLGRFQDRESSFMVRISDWGRQLLSQMTSHSLISPQKMLSLINNMFCEDLSCMWTCTEAHGIDNPI